MKLGADTPVVELHSFPIASLSAGLSRKLAAAVARFVGKSSADDANVGDLLSYFPMRYEDRSNMIPIDRISDGFESAVDLYVRVARGYKVGRNRPPGAPPLYIFEISASDAENHQKPIVVWWFISGKSAKRIVDYWKQRFSRGARFVAFGKWEWDKRRKTLALKLAKPDELEILSGEDLDEGEVEGDLSGEEDSCNESHGADEDPQPRMVHTGRRVPVYRKLGVFRTKRIREIIYDVLEMIEPESTRDRMPSGLAERLKLISRADAIREIHFPPEKTTLEDYAAFRSEAHRRLIFEEFFWACFAVRLLRTERKVKRKERRTSITPEMREDIKALVPFELTNAQKRVTQQIFDDLCSDSPMNRLIQGDVGSGKTIVAFIALMAAMENGFQTALMAPTEILAEQHFRNARTLFESTRYRIALLKGSMKASEKKEIHRSLAEGAIDLVIGTHAIIQESIEFDQLGLAVIDEQHRFGVLQRSQLREFGDDPDVLVMTATPIPRSLAMTVYGDLDVSVIDELPPGRTPIKTVVVGEDKRNGVYKGIEREIARGRQVYIVYPLIEESEKMDLKAATDMFVHLRDEIFQNRRVGLLHGRLKAEEKNRIMSDFISGRMDILVSTTVIEVGVDVPNATLMVVEHAERFGLSQLHQLRGRVGRGSEESYCVLLTADRRTAVARERLGIMERSSDGFVIAEKDLELRGQGEILGTKQSGVRGFKIGNIVRDLKILEVAAREADRLIGEDGDDPEMKDLKESVKNDPRFLLGKVG